MSKSNKAVIAEKILNLLESKEFRDKLDLQLVADEMSKKYGKVRETNAAKKEITEALADVFFIVKGEPKKDCLLNIFLKEEGTALSEMVNSMFRASEYSQVFAFDLVKYAPQTGICVVGLNPGQTYSLEFGYSSTEPEYVISKITLKSPDYKPKSAKKVRSDLVKVSYHGNKGMLVMGDCTFFSGNDEGISFQNHFGSFMEMKQKIFIHDEYSEGEYYNLSLKGKEEDWGIVFTGITTHPRFNVYVHEKKVVKLTIEIEKTDKSIQKGKYTPGLYFPTGTLIFGAPINLID